MGIWHRAFRPHCRGLFVEGGALYAQGDASGPPVPIPLNDARIFLDIEVGSRRPVDLPEGATCHRPADPPPAKGGKLYTVAVYTAAGDVFIGYPSSGGEARNIFRAIEKLVTSSR
jgi:hypothetical protein